MAEDKNTTSNPEEAEAAEAAASAEETQAESAAPTPAPAPKKDRSKVNLDSKDKDKKKKKEPGKVKRWFKDFFSELKKVTWPSFTKVLKQTGTVLVVTICFLLVLMAFDSLFGYLYRLLVGGLTSEAVTVATAMFGGGGGLL